MSADFADRDRVNYDVESIEREYDAMLKPQPEQRAPTIVTEHVFVGSTRCEIHDTTVPHCEYCGHRFVGRAHECAEMRAWNAPARAPMPDDTPDAPAAREDAQLLLMFANVICPKLRDVLVPYGALAANWDDVANQLRRIAGSLTSVPVEP